MVGSIDEDGYLRRETSAIVDDLAFRQNIMATEEEVEAIIRRIQLFDPPGAVSYTHLDVYKRQTRNNLTRCCIFVFFTFKFTALFLCKGGIF